MISGFHPARGSLSETLLSPSIVSLNLIIDWNHCGCQHARKMFNGYLYDCYSRTVIKAFSSVAFQSDLISLTTHESYRSEAIHLSLAVVTRACQVF